MTIERICGHILLWAGFLAGSFVAVQRTEVQGNPWATITWSTFIVAMGVSVVGVILLRRTSRVLPETAAAGEGRLDQSLALLNRIVSAVERQVNEWEPSQVYATHGRIDAELAELLAEFAERRHAIAHACGLRAYGQVMTDFAQGERQINRAWCASADGYADEVERCLHDALTSLQSAATRLESLVSDLRARLTSA